eukprot:gene15484-18387_t
MSLTFNINDLPLIVIRKILGYFQRHFIRLEKLHPKLKTLYRNDVVIRLSLVCKMWASRVVPYLADSTYSIYSKQTLESYLKIAGYGVLYPAKLLPFNQPVNNKMNLIPRNLPPQIPFCISRLDIHIDQRQVAHTQLSVIPPSIYAMMIPSTGDTLHWLKFSTRQTHYADLANLLEAACQSKSLATLDIANSFYTEDSMDALISLVSSSSTLTSLNLTNMKSPKGVTKVQVEALIQAFKASQSLRKINLLDATLITNTHYLPLVEALASKPGLVRLAFSPPLNPPPPGTQVFGEPSPTLTHMRTSIQPSVVQSLVRYINSAPMLTSLDLAHSQLSPDNIYPLLNAVSNHDKIKSLCLSGALSISNLDPLYSSTLSRLELAHTALSDQEASNLFRALKTNSALAHLDVGHNNLSVSSHELIALICSNHTLTTLLLGNNLFGDNIMKISLALKISKVLTRVDLSNNNINDDGGVHLCDYIKSSKCIKYLKIGGNQFKLKTPHHLQAALSINQSLITLDLSGLPVTTVGLEGILYSLTSHKSISVVIIKNLPQETLRLLTTLLQTLGLRCVVVSSFGNGDY